MVEVAVIGAGVAGLLLALNLKSRATIFESCRLGLRGRRCAGIVSMATLTRLPEGWKFVEQEYDSMELVVPELSLRVSVGSSKPFAYKLDRAAHEERLAELLEARGIEIREGVRVRSVEPLAKGVRVRWSGGELICEAAVLAEGYPAILAERCKLSPRVEARIGVHTLALADGISEHALYVLYSPKLLKGFAWAAPLDAHHCSFGIVTRYRDVQRVLRGAAAMASRMTGARFELERGLRGGYVLRGYPHTLGRGRLFVFGDAAAMVKSLSGGGLYAIAALCKPLASVVDSVAAGEETERELLNGIRKTLAVLRRSFLLAEHVDRIVTEAPRLGLRFEAEVRRLEYDDHAAALAQILAGVRGLQRSTAPRLRTGLGPS